MSSSSTQVLLSRRSAHGKRPTIKDIAARLNVHPSTISLALRDSPEISEAMRKKVRDLSLELGYQRNHSASALRSQSSDTIGLVFPYTSIPHYGTLLDHLCQQIEAKGLRSEIIFHGWKADRERQAFSTFLQRQALGIITIPSIHNVGDLYAELFPSAKTPPIPLVTLGCSASPFIHASIEPDLKKGGEEIGRHLLQKGHRSIALLCHQKPGKETTFFQISQGIKTAIKNAPEASLHLISPVEDHAEPSAPRHTHLFGQLPANLFRTAENIASQYLRLKKRPSAVVTTNEVTAYLMLEMARALGLAVPRDFSITTFGGTAFSAIGALPLTSMEIPYANIALTAIETLLLPPDPLSRIHRQMPLELIERASVVEHP